MSPPPVRADVVTSLLRLEVGAHGPVPADDIDRAIDASAVERLLAAEIKLRATDSAGHAAYVAARLGRTDHRPGSVPRVRRDVVAAAVQCQVDTDTAPPADALTFALTATPAEQLAADEIVLHRTDRPAHLQFTVARAQLAAMLTSAAGG